jgi:ribosomal protein L40E
MIAEIVAALVVGVLTLGLVLEPLLRGPSRRTPAAPDLVDPEETPRGAALAALKEIEFDRATGKLSDSDYAMLMERYTQTAVQAMREEQSAAAPPADVPRSGSPDAIEAVIAAKVRALRSASVPPVSGLPVCSSCGPRPEPDAVFCSTCGRRLPTGLACHSCGATLALESRFCEACGQKTLRSA